MGGMKVEGLMDSESKILSQVRGLPCFGSKQERLLEALMALEPMLAYLYAKAKIGCSQYDCSSGDARVHLAMTSHAVRELVNSLPDFLSVDGKSGNYSKGDKAKSRLADLAYGLSKCGADGDKRTFEISAGLYEALVDFGEQEKASNACMRQRAACALMDHPDTEDPSLDLWVKVREFFVSYAHVNRSQTKALPSNEKVAESFERLETILSARMKVFYDLKSELRGLLARANDKEESGDAIPSENEVENALSFLTSDGLRFVFYSELTNPNWAKPLFDAHAFRALPCEAEGRACPPWHQWAYLSKVAAKEPRVVGEAIEEAARSGNFAARSRIIDIAASLPPSYAAPVAREIASWADEEGAVGQWYWHNEGLLSLIKSLENGGRDAERSANSLIDALFRPRGKSRPYGNVSACVPEYCYEDWLLEAIRDKGYSRSFGIVARNLKFYLSLSAGEDGFSDSSYIIPDLEEGGEWPDRSIGLSLCRVMVDLMRRGVQECPENLLRSLEGGPSIVGRAALLALSLEIESLDGGPVPDTVVKLSDSALDSDMVYEDEMRFEFHRLVGACSSRSDFFNLAPCIYRIASDPSPKREKIKESLVLLQLEGAQAEQGLDEELRLWQYRNLLAFDRASLDDESLALLEDLDAEFGCKEYPDRRFWSNGWNSPSPGLDVEQMHAMLPVRVISFLGDWNPENEEESFSGQARALGGLVAKSPDFFVGCEGDFFGLRPCYCLEALGAWRILLEEGGSIPADSVAAACVAICRHADDDCFTGPNGASDDGEKYFPVKTRAVEVLQEMVKRGLVGEGSPLWGDIVKSFVEASSYSDECRRRERDAINQGESPRSLVYGLPCTFAFEGSVRALLATEEPSIKDALLGSIARSLGDALRSPVMAVQSGRLFGLLMECEMGNSSAFADLFCDADGFGSNRNKQVAFVSALTFWSCRRQRIAMLRGAMEAALSHGDAELGVTSGNSHLDCFDLIGNWVDAGYVAGELDFDDPLVSSWESASDDEHLASSLSRACQRFHATKQPDQGVVSRMIRLWERREGIAEAARPGVLSGISWLARSESLDFAWRMARLSSSFRLNPCPEELHLMESELLAIAEQSPIEAVGILHHAAIAEGCESWMLDSIACSVLATAKMVGGEEVENETARCMDTLFGLGMVSLDDQIDNYVRTILLGQD